jgi:hypothetical protein
MNFIVEKLFSSSTLPNTKIIANYSSFKYFDNYVTNMIFEAKHPHNLVVDCNQVVDVGHHG